MCEQLREHSVWMADVLVFRTEEVRVLTPASSANLGPGFDSAGLALGLEDELVAQVNDAPGIVVQVTGECAHSVPLDENHLVVRAMNLAFDAMGARPAGFTLRCLNRIPHGRGLGSSAAAIIGGMVLARALVADESLRLTDVQLLHAALALESHPDNLAAALFGGVTIAWVDANGAVDFVRCSPHSSVQPVVAFPDKPLATKAARKALPGTIPLSDAVHNISRAAVLLHAMTTDPTKLLAATSDRLHQDARASMYPETMALMARLRGEGIAAFVSGAGPAVLGLGDLDREKMAAAAPEGWTVLALPVSAVGAREASLSQPA
jgi:homoserine kinase